MGSAPAPQVQVSEPPSSSLMASEAPAKQVDGSLLIAEDRKVGVLSFQAYASYFQHASQSGSLFIGALLFLLVFALALLAEAIRAWNWVE